MGKRRARADELVAISKGLGGRLWRKRFRTPVPAEGKENGHEPEA